MMSSNDTSLIEKEGANVDGADRDRAERVGRAANPVCHDLNCASLHLTVVASMAHMKVKGLDAGRGTEKWHKVLAIVEGKMSLSRDAES